MSGHDLDNAPAADGADKLHQHHRQQLSALLDGELPPDQARFLLRRLEHDASLADCWERWHMVGDALRGHVQTPVPRRVASHIREAVALEAGPVPASVASPGGRARRPAWHHGVGALALAASVAAVALFVTRPLGVADMPAPGMAATAPTAAPVAPEGRPVAQTASAEPAVPTSGVPADPPVRAATIAKADPRQVQLRVRPTGGAAAGVTPAAEPVVADPAEAIVAGPAPFARPDLPASRPWPRAVLPQMGQARAGSFTVDYAEALISPSSPSFYPFEPRGGDVGRVDPQADPTPR